MVGKAYKSQSRELQSRELICDLQSWFDSLDWRPLNRTHGTTFGTFKAIIR
jgi:hypothetical protein